MTPIPINLAVEDDLSEWMLRRILRERPAEYAIGPVFKKGGFGYLKKMVPAFNNMAKASPVLLLTDLDTYACPPSLVNDWLVHPKHPLFLFRVAVREVEAWLLASDKELSSFLSMRKSLNIPAPETLDDPKAELLKLAASSPRRELRDAITRRYRGGNLLQGPAYNSTLAGFLDEHWSAAAACDKCSSLQRIFDALSNLEKNFN